MHSQNLSAYTRVEPIDLIQYKREDSSVIILETKGISKSYGKTKALDNVDIQIQEGEILGLLGPNGAGKSTLISVILGILSPNSGEVNYKGSRLNLKNSGNYKKNLGLVPQDLAFFPELSAKQNVDFWGRIYGLRGSELKTATEKALQFTGLLDRKKAVPSKFSGGLKRRLNIACGIVHSPEILFLDEPTVGVDPQSRNHILASIKELNRLGTTIVYSSHYMEEVESICDRVIIMDNGHVIASGTPEGLVNEISPKSVMTLELKNSNRASSTLDRISEVLEYRQEDQKYVITLENNAAVAKVLTELTEAGSEVLSVAMTRKNLENVFFHYTGNNFRD